MSREEDKREDACMMSPERWRDMWRGHWMMISEYDLCDLRKRYIDSTPRSVCPPTIASDEEPSPTRPH